MLLVSLFFLRCCVHCKGMIKTFKKGFTLIELLVVIAIIGVLTTIVVSELSQAREKAKIARMTQEIRSFQNALELYYADNGEYPFHGDSAHNYYIITPTNTANGLYYDDLRTKMEPYFNLDEMFDDLPNSFQGSFVFSPVYNPSSCPNQAPGGNLQTYAFTFTTFEQELDPYTGGSYITSFNNSPIIDAYYVNSTYSSSGHFGSYYRHNHCASLN